MEIVAHNQKLVKVTPYALKFKAIKYLLHPTVLIFFLSSPLTDTQHHKIQKCVPIGYDLSLVISLKST